jgi:CheY-like chemotaxis protein
VQSEFDALIVASGEEARAQLARSPDQIQVVLMDISLRGSEDGLTLTRYLRSQDRWKDVPIIATTAHAFPEDRTSALAAGCDAYLAKPFDRGELLSLMRTTLASARGAAAPLGAETPWHASS